MHDYNTIVGVIDLRSRKVSHNIIRQRYGIGNSGIALIMNRYWTRVRRLFELY